MVLKVLCFLIAICLFNQLFYFGFKIAEIGISVAAVSTLDNKCFIVQD